MQAIGYVRVSTEEQARSGLSIESQEKKVRLYCELHELALAELIVDGGASAKSLDRPGAVRLLELLRAKRGPDHLVVAKLDRLTRSLKDWQALIDEFFGETRPKKLHSVAESIDTSTAAGRLALNVMMTVAQWEREVIGERTKEALAVKIARGVRVGKVRYGYDLAEDDAPPPTDGTKREAMLIENPREQQGLKLMSVWRDQGKSFREIAELLEYHGFRTKAGAKKWDAKTVQRLVGRAS